MVTDLTIELLVGGDFLQKHRAVLSYSDLSVSYHGIDARVYMEPYKEQKAYAKTDHAAVVTTEDINLQGDKIITIQALAQLDTAGIRSAKSWEFIPLEALTLECGILIPHTMVTVDKDGMVPVTLRTAFGQDMILSKGTVLGTLRTTQHIVSVRSIAKSDVDPQPKDATVTGVPREADEAKFALFLEKTLIIFVSCMLPVTDYFLNPKVVLSQIHANKLKCSEILNEKILELRKDFSLHDDT